MSQDEEFLRRAGIRGGIDRAELKRIDASRVTLAIQDPHLGTVRSMQVAGTWQRCEFIDGIDAPQDVIDQCVAIDLTSRL